MRFGKNNSQLIFEKGQKHISYYETEYGSFTVGVFSNLVDIDVDDSGGEIAIDYFLEVNSSMTQENDLCLQIKEAGFERDKLNRRCNKPN